MSADTNRDFGKSPFPGMDPYLEDPAHWPDFHSTFILAFRRKLLERLPLDLYARVEESVILVAPRERTTLLGDVFVTREPGTNPVRTNGGVRDASAPTLRLANTFDFDDASYPYIEVIDKASHEVLTVVELLSPSNKKDSDWAIYRDKRQRLLAARRNLVEIDLLREGKRIQLSGPLPKADYFAFVSKADAADGCDVFAWNVRDRMPAIPVPISGKVVDVVVDLQEVFDSAFDDAKYGRQIDYSKPPIPPLAGVDADFAIALAAKRAS